MIGKTISHYRVLEKLGSGGMGVVYKAEDTLLGRAVALKFLPEDISVDHDALERFQREARMASALNHPHICTVHDVAEYEGRPFIVMELMDGETLKQKLKGRPFETGEILDVAIPVAEALHALHSKGIVHRDIKPANIVITQEGRVKVLDFGLAKLVSEQPGSAPAREGSALSTVPLAPPQLTDPGAAVGTVSYMSPEQARGEKISASSDLFSLGVVLYEMATGTLPFKGNTLAVVFDAILNRAPVPPTHLNPKLAVGLEQIISKALAKTPQDRYPSAAELLGDLKRLKREAELDLTIGWSVSKAAKRLAGRWVAISLLTLITFGAFLLWFSHPKNVVSFDARDWIILGKFQNLTREPLLDDSLDVAFRLGLEQSRYANILPDPEVRKVLSRMKRDENSRVDRYVGVDICKREAIKALVLGSVVRVGNTYSLSAEIIDPETGRSVFTDTASTQSQDGILQALEGLARRVREHLGESLAAITQTTLPLQKVTTSNLGALKVYSLGLDNFNHGRYDEAIDLFQRAIKLDPEFAMAHAKLGAAYSSSGKNPQEAALHWQTALKFSDRLTEYERLYVEGSNAWGGKPDEMIHVWSLLSTLYPDIAEGHHNLGIAYLLYENKFQEAAAAFTQAAAVRNPRSFLSYKYLGYCQLAVDQFEPAMKSFQKAWEMEKNPLVALGVADGHIALRRYQEAGDLLDGALRSPERIHQTEGAARLAALDLDQGRLRNAARVHEEASGRARSLGMKSWEYDSVLGLLACQERREDRDGFRATLRRAIDNEMKMIEGDSEQFRSASALRLSLLGKVWARNYGAQGAEEILLRIKSVADLKWGAHARILEGEIALARKKAPAAAEIFKGILSEINLFQAHESLARAYEAQGSTDHAIEQYDWLMRNRGQAFAEYLNQLSGRDFNILDSAAASFHLGTVYEQKGAKDKATSHYQKFTDAWRNADPDLPLLKEAKRRMKSLSKN